MNTKIKEFKSYIKGKKVGVIGIGVSNTPLIKFLCENAAKVTAFDKANEEKIKPFMNELSNYQVEYVLGENYLSKLEGFDIVFKTPGMRFDIPELVEARKRGTLITSEMEVFFDLCPAKIFAVTGSDGKTTTTTIIHELLKSSGYKCWLGGNIGKPLLSEVEKIKEDDMVVLELSSFQLQTMKKSPQVAVITNISPNHLDFHKDMKEYVDSKLNIIKFQNKSDRVVLNFDNEYSKEISKQAVSDVIYFTRKEKVSKGAYIEDNCIVYVDNDEKLIIIDKNDILIPGEHNVENFMAAFCAVYGYVSPFIMRNVAREFRGVAHRIEKVREVNGISFFNDSIGTSPTRTIASINAFNQKLILIAGGYDKKLSYEPLGAVIADKVKCLVLLGQTSDKIEKAYIDEMAKRNKKPDMPILKCKDMNEAVMKAYKSAKKGDIILLSPASASFDMYRNFEERGNVFKEIVNGLGSIVNI